MQQSVTALSPLARTAAVFRGRRDSFLRAPYSVLLFVLLAVIAGQFLGRTNSEWDYCFVATSEHLLSGDDIYAVPGTGWTYPPFQALFGVPVLGMPKIAQRAAWFAANGICFVYLLRTSWRLAGGGPLRFARDGREQLALWIGLLSGLPFALNALSHQQTDIVLAAFVVAGVDRLSRGRGKSAGAAFGLAAAMKCTPILFAPYLILRGRFAAAAVMVAVTVGASLLPDLIASPPLGGVWAGRWYERYLEPMTKPDYTPGIWASSVIYNQSFVGLSNRWTHTTVETAPGKATLVEITPTLSPSELKRILLILAAGCGLIGLLGVRAGRTSPEPEVSVNGAGLVISGMLLFSPMSSPAHFGLLLLPGFVLGRAAAVRGKTWAWPLAAVTVSAGLLANKDLWGEPLYTLGFWYGLPTWSALACLIGSFAAQLKPPGRVA